MTGRAVSFDLGRNRRRFATFGGALILAACLTLVKLSLVALEVNEHGLVAWLGASAPTAPARYDGGPAPMAKAEAEPAPVLWPTVLPEPAAGPTDGATDDEKEPATPFGDPEPDIDPTKLTAGEIQALQQLAERSRQLDERERLLALSAELNKQVESRLDEQIAQLEDLKNRIEALMIELDEAEEEKIARLVKIYETMKPKAAAEIFNRLDLGVLLHVVERMKEAKSAVVLGKMDPKVAKRLTTELARQKERPSVTGNDLGS